MLDRYIEIIDKLFFLPDRVEQLVGDPFGIGIKGADPSQSLDLAKLPQQLRQCGMAVNILAVPGGVLRDYDQLGHSLGGKPLRFGDDVLHLPAAEPPPDRGDRAVAATVDLSGTNLLGAQTVTVTNTTSKGKYITVKAKAAQAAPFAITSAIDIKEYKDTDVATISSYVTGLANSDADVQAANLARLNAYLRTFTSLYGTEYDGTTTKYSAKLTLVSANSNDVTLTIGKTVDARGQQKSVTIDGLKK